MFSLVAEAIMFLGSLREQDTEILVSFKSDFFLVCEGSMG